MQQQNSLQFPTGLPVAASVHQSIGAHHHAVQFYENEQFLSAAVADFLAEGLGKGGGAIVIATPAHRETFGYRLKAKGLDPQALQGQGKLLWLDARETLATFMAHPTPDRDRFQRSVGTVVEGFVRASGSHGVRAYGEMVDLLWKDGNIEGAIQLEELWNDLQQTHRFALLCAYAMGNFYKASHSQAFDHICHKHTHVLPTERYLDVDVGGRLREIGQLQQRARALETEIEHREELEQRLRVALAAKIHAEEELKRSLADREALLERERAARTEAEAASKAKNEFLAVMSHELRTPLNAIGGHVQLLEMGIHGPVAEAQREALFRIERSQRHLLALINDILNLTRIEAGRVQYMLEDVALEPLVFEVRAMLEPLLAQHTLRLEVDTAVTPLGTRRIAARADRDKIQQILLNLLSNAIKFTPGGGRIAVSIGAGNQSRPAAFVEVSDTGIGIDETKLDEIFQPFVQLVSRPANRPDGVGLGLSISRELARGMGGDLVAASTLGRGATFTLSLPLA
jgi:signal transduction histidine kinase